MKTPNRYQQVYGAGSKPTVSDYYLNHFPNKPKSEIAAYVASQGIRIPDIFDNLNHARKSGKDFIIRSEHPIEYYGAAGLFESTVVNDQSKNAATTKTQTIGHSIDRERLNSIAIGTTRDLYYVLINRIQSIAQTELESSMQKIEEQYSRQYPQLLGVDPTQFMSHLGYSYRELLGGYNRSMVEDNAVPGRYHLFTTGQKPKGKYVNYTIAELGKGIVFSGPLPLEDQLISRIHGDIEYYECIRSLSRFDVNHCPIIEFQTNNNQNYFLQYHRTRDKHTSGEFQLDNPAKPNQVKALFSRGKTPSTGLTINTHIYFDNHFQKPTIVVPNQEDGAFDLHRNHTFTEIMTRKRKVQFYGGHQGMNFFAAKAITGHIPKSMLFNPEISIILLENEITPYMTGLYKRYKQNGDKLSLPMHIISDGKNASVEFLE